MVYDDIQKDSKAQSEHWRQSNRHEKEIQKHFKMSYDDGKKDRMIKNSTAMKKDNNKANEEVVENLVREVEKTGDYEYFFTVNLDDEGEDSVPNVYTDARLQNDTEKEVRCLKAMLEAIQFRLCYLGAISEEDLMKQLGVEG